MIVDDLTIDEREIHEEFLRAAGPGGQNVNKVSTAVRLRFDVLHSRSLSAGIKSRLIRLAGRRVDADGVLRIEAQRYRTQEQNRADARDRLIDLIRLAAVEPKTRRKTKPTRAARQRRLETKRRKGTVKALRGRPEPE